MMVVKVEVWPGGDEDRAFEIERLYVGNVSDLAEVSDYAYRFGDREWLEPGTSFIYDHLRSDGAWELVRRVLDEQARGVPR